ncbi:PREDICTED: nestin [Lepidothrix coronata]|uniref:Nestin n=1 Tax=Lepidothrix coronata TaxID=321398 RepID=A0A6J0GPV9_9PASS|nr:PREDICTED: nestin [Lepidothrix coronata]
MLSTESFTGARALGEESLQMWDLNKRLEAYLARVKFLEEENEVLRAEIQSAKGSPAGDSWRVKYEEELRALRDALDHAFREKCMAELARDNLYEEVQQVKSRCQKEQAAREEAKKQLSLSRKELEEERRAQIWLKERAVQLEKEVEALLEVHEEEKAGLDQEIASYSQSLESFRCAPVAFQPVEVEDYSKRLSEIWKGAVETYKTEVSQLEGSLCQAKENLWKAVEDNHQSQLQLQHLEKDLAGLKVRKEMLEESLAQQWQEQRGEAEKFQLAMEALEQEQQSLRVQIARVLEDRQQLMHLKMSLSLEVATYRTLLEAESTRLQMPAGEFRLVNGVRDLKLEVSSGSKLVPASPEPRRLLPRDHGANPSVFPRAEGRGQPAKPQSDALTPKSRSPDARELQKISSVLHGTAAGRAGRPGAPGCPTPSPSQAAPPLSPEPPSPSPPEPGSPGGEGPAWPGGAGGVTSQGLEHPLPGATTESPEDGVKAPGTAPTRSLQYPAQLVSHALEDALKEVEDDAQPEEEPTLSAAWAPQDARAPSPVFPTEACGGAVAEGTGEGQDPSEGSGDGDGPEVEERAGEAELQGLGVESSILGDRATSPLGTALSDTVRREEMGAWEEEEVPAVLSPRDPEAEVQEEDVSGPGQTETSWEKPGQEEDGEETPSTEPSQPSEDEEEREPHSSCQEDGDFHGEGGDEPKEESPDGEVEAVCAVLVESHLVSPTKSHLEEDFVDAEQEKSEHQKMIVCETEAAEQERGQELCPEQEPLTVHEAIPAEEASSGAEEDAVGGEDTGRVKDGEGEEGEASREMLGGEDPGAGEDLEAGEDPGVGEDPGAGEDLEAGEDPKAGEDPRVGEDPEAGEDPRKGEDPGTEEDPEAGETAGGDTLGWESRAPEEPEDVQEARASVEEGGEQELELEEEPQGKGDDGNGQEPCPGDWEVTAEDTEGALGTEESSWADDTPSSTGRLESEERDGTSPAELEEAQEDDEEDAKSQGMSQQQPLPEAEPAPELAREEQEGTAGQPDPATPHAPGRGDSQEPAEAPEEVQGEDAEEGLGSELGQPESSSSGLEALQEVSGEGTESSEWAEEDFGRSGDSEPIPGTGRRVELEDTLPDSTPLHLYEGEMLAGGAPSQTPPETEETTETDPVTETALEGEEWLEGRDKPLTPTMPESPEEEAEAEVAPVAEGAEEEEGYFMVSAPSQEVSSSEEAEISEDFEEIKVEATEGSQGDLGAPREASPVPEGKGHLQTFVGEARKLQAQAVPEQAEQAEQPSEQPSDEQPPVEEEAPDSDSPPSAGDEQPPEADPPRPGSALEQRGFPEVITDIPDTALLPAKVPVDVMKDSDILEIVEQALEFNQELVMGVRAAEGGQQGPGRTELPQDAGEDSSPASSSEEEPTVQEAPEPEGRVQAANGLHREASLEDLAEFTEEVLNGIASMAPAQEFPSGTADPSVGMPVQPPPPRDTKLGDGTPWGKHGRADPVPPALGEDVLCLTPDQPPACRLRAEQEPWSSGDE